MDRVCGSGISISRVWEHGIPDGNASSYCIFYKRDDAHPGTDQDTGRQCNTATNTLDDSDKKTSHGHFHTGC